METRLLREDLQPKLEFADRQKQQLPLERLFIEDMDLLSAPNSLDTTSKPPRKLRFHPQQNDFIAELKKWAKVLLQRKKEEKKELPVKHKRNVLT